MFFDFFRSKSEEKEKAHTLTNQIATVHSENNKQDKENNNNNVGASKSPFIQILSIPSIICIVCNSSAAFSAAAARR